jgi:hypothetical protein
MPEHGSKSLILVKEQTQGMEIAKMHSSQQAEEREL